MWKLLCLLALCGLLSPSEGKVPGIRSVFSNTEINKVLISVLKQNDLLGNHLKAITLSDIDLGGLLSLTGKIAGLKVSSAQITGSAVVLLPDKINVTISVHVEITGSALLLTTSAVSISLDLSLRVIYGFENFSDGFLDVKFYECANAYGAIDIQVLGISLPLSAITTIQNSIIADLNLQLCPILKVVFDVAKVVLLNTLNVVFPLGIYGNVKIQLASLPALLDAYVGIDLYVDLQVAGTIISIPSVALSIGVPLLHNYKHCQAIHPGVVNIVLSVISPKQPVELSCTPDKYSKADELRNAILALIPAGSSAIISANTLYLRIFLLVDPVIEFKATGAIVFAKVQVEVFVKNADGSVLSVLVVSSNLKLAAAISVVSSKLKIVLSISGNPLLLVSSGVGIIDVSSLVSHFNNLLAEIFLPLINGPLASGIHLPAILGISLDSVFIQLTDGALLLYI
ncbi:BPI fold-containing family B member 4-like [Sceloporus undulatus]|uniref:BPI fold-containing family B member 4-like n=1 Tax=Sceloporus undulatus TaxID=8520 RepID=UPI001C4D328A|nr:BPI fold-containing family B member 4-like [Sceloporus undulatus]